VTTPANLPAGRVTSAEISALITWMRQLPGASPAGPAELAAFHHAKQALLARIAAHNTPGDQPSDQQEHPSD
jgi:mono/diheme cytochrome c family protein